MVEGEIGTGGGWLDRYATGYHKWHKSIENSQEIYRRRLGLVETSFFIDGQFFEGRADVNALATLEISHRLSQNDLKYQILLAWACLRLKHVLLLARIQANDNPNAQNFEIQRPNSIKQALEEAAKSLIFVDDTYKNVDPSELWRHCTNTARLIDPDQACSKLFVLPFEFLTNGNILLRYLWISAHMVTDGLTMYNWTSSFLELLNASERQLQHRITKYCGSAGLPLDLPQAQEDLYPEITGSLARQRWFWAIMRILRHVRKPLPAAFPNPLRRAERRAEAVLLEEEFADLFDYSPSRKPPLNAFTRKFSLSPRASDRLQKLARSTGASIGAGCFALVGLAMMEIEEGKHPNIPLSERKPFIASFPLNPRPFFNTQTANSCMLAFSDGIVMPFLPSGLPFEGRFKLTTLAAHRQLKQYQKRRKGVDAVVGSHSPARMIASNYIAAVERVEMKLPPERRKGINPQGAYPANVDYGTATCGVSSIGAVEQWVSSGKYRLDDEEKDFAADFREIRMGVRARENEFLVGSDTSAEGIVNFGSSFDGNAIDEESFGRFEEKIKTLLEVNGKAKL